MRPALHAAEQLVAGEGDDVGVLHRVHHGGLARQPVGGEVDEVAASEVVEHDDAALAAQRAEVGVGHLGG